MMQRTDGEWLPDPTGRFEQRFYLDRRPTALVRDGRAESLDDPSGLPSLPLLPPVPEDRLPDLELAVTGGAASPRRSSSSTGHVRTVIRAAGAVVVVVGLVLAGQAGWRAASDRVATTQVSSWDPAVQSTVSFVEAQRGLGFRRPLKVERGTPPRAATLDAGTVALLDALGLDAQTSAPTTALAGYDPARKVIVVRPGDLDAEATSALAGALDRALVDQVLDPRGSRGIGGEGLSTGDAAIVEAAARAAGGLAPAPAPVGPGATAGDVVLATPALLGPALVDGLRAVGGAPALDGAYGELPASVGALTDPVPWATGWRPSAASAPEMDGTAIDGSPDEVGPTVWAMALGTALPLDQAMGAVTGWSGDAVRLRRDEGGRVCADAAVVFTSPDRSTAFAAAMGHWAAARPAGLASVEQVGGAVHVTGCAAPPGSAPAAVTTPTQVALAIAARARLQVDLASAGVTSPVARCASDHLAAAVHVTTSGEVRTPSAAERDAAVQACRA